MNVDMECLVPYSFEEFTEHPNQIHETVNAIKAKYQLYMKKRNQALAILKLRMKDLAKGENYSTTSKYDVALFKMHS